MRTSGVAFILACLVSGLLTPMVRRFALKRGLFDDHVAARKIHGRPIPRLGGIAIAAGFYAPLLGLLLAVTGVGGTFWANSRQAIAFLIGGVAVCSLGLYDDIRGSGALKKFAAQFLIAGVLYYFGFRIDRVSLPFIGSFSLGQLSLLATLLWIVGVVNAMNLIDGLDGLAAGVGLFGLATTFVLAATRNDPIMMLFTASLAGATVGFLVYNFNPASIFMGDTGSMFLGYVLAVGSIQTNQKSSTAVAILIPIVALGLPIMDTLLAMIRRAINHQPIFSADRAHIHHKLLDLGLSHKQAVLVLYGTSLLLGATALLLTVASRFQSAVILLVMGTAGFIGIRALGYGHLRRSADAKAALEVNRRLGRLAAAADERALWRALKVVAEGMGFTSVRLNIGYQHDGDPISIQCVHGDWRESGFLGKMEVAAGNAIVKVEYRGATSLGKGELDQLRQALETASTRLFGEPSGAKPLPVREGTQVVG
jgi:UDP-GlcNAc:undecaprenyl-phosphate/decaprenyl-phosphate GlcNAc-1-phosphate transferase